MVSAGALPGGSALSVAAATFSTADGIPSTTTLGSLNLANGAKLVLDAGDQLTTAATATTSGSLALILSGTSGLASGTPYTVVQAAGGLTGEVYNVAFNNPNYTATFNISATSITITPITATPLGTAYWYGSGWAAPRRPWPSPTAP